MKDDRIDPEVYALHDQYCNGAMARRDFLRRAAALTAVGGSALAMAQSLLPNCAKAHTVSFTDPRIEPRYVTYDSPGGNGTKMRGYLAQPAEGGGAERQPGPFPAVRVVHDNRGLNPYVEDVARRLAVAGFLALAPDALTPLGGYPGNDDDGKALQASLDRAKILVDTENSARFLKAHPLSSGRLGVTGFCFGGLVSNHLAVALGEDLRASAPFYGTAPRTEDAPKITARMLVHYADKRPPRERDASRL